MMRLTRKTLLAIEAVLDVALYARPDPVQSKDITKRQGVPQRYLEQVMQQLVHRGILQSVRGPKGGYILARERRRISVGEIVRLVDELERSTEGGSQDLSELLSQIVQPLWNEIETDMLRRLDAVTIEELSERANKQGVAAIPVDTKDFTI